METGWVDDWGKMYREWVIPNVTSDAFFMLVMKAFHGNDIGPWIYVLDDDWGREDFVMPKFREEHWVSRCSYALMDQDGWVNGFDWGFEQGVEAAAVAEGKDSGTGTGKGQR